jgi:hypothetical protein
MDEANLLPPFKKTMMKIFITKVHTIDDKLSELGQDDMWLGKGPCSHKFTSHSLSTIMLCMMRQAIMMSNISSTHILAG